MAQERDGGWLPWIANKATQGIENAVHEVLEAPVRSVVKPAAAILALLAALSLLWCALSCCCRASKRWCTRRSRVRQMAALAADGRHPACRNCGARGHATTDCTREVRNTPRTTRPFPTAYPLPLAATLAATVASCETGTTHGPSRPITTQFAPCKVESPLMPIVFTPQKGQAAMANATIDTGATVSARQKDLIGKLGWTQATTHAEEALSLVGVGTEEAKALVEGTLLIGKQVPHNVRLWAAPINLTKVPPGNDVLSQVAEIELEHGDLRRFQVATAEEVALEAQPDIAKEVVEHPKKLRATDFADSVLDVETQEKKPQTCIDMGIPAHDNTSHGRHQCLPCQRSNQTRQT